MCGLNKREGGRCFSQLVQFGGAIAYGIGHLNGASGLAGWRWLFILEGIPSCLSALVVLAFLPNYPEDVGWLSGPEKALAVQRLLREGSKGHHPTMSWADAKATLTDWRLYAHYTLYFAISPGFSSLSLFAPSIVAGLGYRDLMAQLMTVPPWAAAYGECRLEDVHLIVCGLRQAASLGIARMSVLEPGRFIADAQSCEAVCQVAVAYSADRFNARGVHTAGAALVGATGFVVSAALPPTAYAARYGGLVVATSGAFACIPPLLGWLSCNLSSTASTGLAIAINVSVGGGLGQIPGVWIYKSSEAGGGYPTGHWTNAAFMFLVVVLSLGLRLFYGRENGRLEARRSGQVRLYKL